MLLFDELDKNKLRYYFKKFGKGNFIGPHYIVKKGKIIKVKGNSESIYDFTYYFLRGKKSKVKGKIYVPLGLDYETDLKIVKEEKKQRYTELKVEGEGYFKADYFFFIGNAENDLGKISTKKPKQTDESDKKYFSFLKADLKENVFGEFSKELEYKINLNIDIQLLKDKKVKIIRKISGEKIKKIDGKEEINTFQLEIEE